MDRLFRPFFFLTSNADKIQRFCHFPTFRCSFLFEWHKNLFLDGFTVDWGDRQHLWSVVVWKPVAARTRWRGWSKVGFRDEGEKRHHKERGPRTPWLDRGHVTRSNQEYDGGGAAARNPARAARRGALWAPAKFCGFLSPGHSFKKRWLG